MFGFAEKAQMMMHEKTLGYAIEHASSNIEGKAEMAGSIQNATNWLARALSKEEYSVEVRELLMQLNPNMWHGTSSSLIQVAEQSRTKHGLALYYSFTILAGIVESRIIEVKRPGMATRVMSFRREALEFTEKMLGYSQQLMNTISETHTGEDSEKFESTSEDVKQVEDCLKKLGFDITVYGISVALLNLESGYNHCETASYLALATLAMDVKVAGTDIIKLIALLPHARAMIDILTSFKNAGQMREELFANDARAILGVTIVGKDQSSWLSKVLSDTVIAQERVATSRISY